MYNKIRILFVIILLFLVNVNQLSGDKNWQKTTLSLEKISLLYPAVECADIDFDGDTDLFLGNWNGFITYFENTGTPESYSFKLESPGITRENSFLNIYTLNKSIPRFIDIDNDGDLDLFIGDNSGNIAFYRNNGTIDSPDFIQVKSGKTKNASYFGINVDLAAAPYFVDIDNDNDYDLFVGNALGYIAYFKNQGTPESPSFSCIYSAKSKKDSFFHILVDQYAVPVFADINDDEKHDLFIGNFNGTIYYYENIGSAAKYKFKLITKNFKGVNVGGDSTPCFVDINNDGIDELIVGNNEGKILLFNSPESKRIAKIISTSPPKEKLEKKTKDKSSEILLNKIEKLIDEQDFIEALNLINNLPGSSDRSKRLKNTANKELKKIYSKFRNDSLLSKEAEPYFKKAIQYYIKGKYEESIKYFDKVFLNVPNHRLSSLYKKRALQKMEFIQNESQAKKLHEKAISKYKNNDVNNAFKYIKQAKELDPENPAYAQLFTKYSNEYYSKLNNKLYNEKIADAKKSISRKKYKEALDALSQLKDKFPEDKKVNDLINICNKNSASLRKAYNKKMKEKYLEKGDEYFSKNDFKNALKNYELASKHAPRDNQIKEKIKSSKSKIKKKEKRILDPAAVKKHFQDGMKFYSMGQYKKAIFEWEKVLELDPNHVMARKNIEKAKKLLK